MDHTQHKMCPLLWKHLCVNTDASLTPCCEIASGTARTKPLDPNKTLQEEYNSSEFKHVRQQMLSGETNLGCDKVCYSRERNGYKSKRLNEIEKFEVKYGYAFTGKETVDANIDDIVYLDIKPSNYCNSKCVMCNNNRSSQIALESKKYRNFKGPAIRGGWYNDNKHKLEPIYKRVWRFKVNGGETSTMPELETILKSLSVAGSPDTHLILNINNTVDITKFDHYLKTLNMISVVCSIEDWGKPNSYIRYPADWDTVYKNLQTIHQYSLDNTNVNMQFGILVLSLNFLSFPRLIEKLHQEFPNGDYFIYHINQPEPLLVSGRTNKELKRGLKNLNNVMTRLPDSINKKLHDTLKFYKKSVKIGTNSDVRKKFLNYINHIDTIRKINIKDYLDIDLER